MKTSTLGLSTLLGMALVGGAVFLSTPRGGFSATPEAQIAERGDDDADADEDAPARPGAEFKVDGAVAVEARLGHPALPASAPGSTFVLVEARGSTDRGGAPAPANLSLVIDKSGSMKGTRHQNAIHAAEVAVDRLNDGDGVSVVAFDTRVELIAPHTVIGPGTRESVKAAIRGIVLGGDTCLSCGVEEGLAELRRAQSRGQGHVARMIVLSDGQANNGVTDLPGFRSMATRALTQGVSITTIGVDVLYDEKALSAIAQTSNGRHYFVENDAGLVRVFESEAQALTESVAAGTVVEIDLAPGVELVQVFDRGFSRSGSRVSVPLSSLGKGETKTVLLEVRLPAGPAGDKPVASVDVAYQDLVEKRDARARGELVVKLVDATADASETDALVLDRLQRSRTGSALREANALVDKGQLDLARRKLEDAKASLGEAQGKAKGRAPAARAKDVDDSFARQEAELDRASSGFATPPAASPANPFDGGAQPAPPRPVQSNQKRNAQIATELAF